MLCGPAQRRYTCLRYPPSIPPLSLHVDVAACLKHDPRGRGAPTGPLLTREKAFIRRGDTSPLPAQTPRADVAPFVRFGPGAQIAADRLGPRPRSSTMRAERACGGGAGPPHRGRQWSGSGNGRRGTGGGPISAWPTGEGADSAVGPCCGLAVAPHGLSGLMSVHVRSMRSRQSDSGAGSPTVALPAGTSLPDGQTESYSSWYGSNEDNSTHRTEVPN
jgi:hypothetical protein